jgi:hypothetical protein
MEIIIEEIMPNMRNGIEKSCPTNMKTNHKVNKNKNRLKIFNIAL